MIIHSSDNTKRKRELPVWFPSNSKQCPKGTAKRQKIRGTACGAKNCVAPEVAAGDDGGCVRQLICQVHHGLVRRHGRHGSC